MAAHAVSISVIYQRYITIGAGRLPAAVLAEYNSSRAAAVEEQQGLFAAREALFHSVSELLRKVRAAGEEGSILEIDNGYVAAGCARGGSLTHLDNWPPALLS